MTLQPRDWTIIPEQTAQIARAAFPKGNIYMKMRDELGVLYADSDFVTLFRADCGQPAISPGQLALVTVMQFAEGLSDRQTAVTVINYCQPSMSRRPQSHCGNSPVWKSCVAFGYSNIIRKPE